MTTLCLLFWLAALAKSSVATTETATTTEAPTCSDGDRQACAGCDVYWYDYGLYAGRDFERNEILPTFSEDVVLQFRQHSRLIWPRWNRYHHLHQVPNRPYHFTYAPGPEWPLECHERLYNTRLLKTPTNNNGTLYQVYADRKLTVGEPLFLDCSLDDRSVDWQIEDLTMPSLPFLQEHGVCIDTLVASHDGGATAKRFLAKGSHIAFGPVLHMHRNELWDEDRQRYEDVIQYAYGHPQTDLLLLPHAPHFSRIAARTTESTLPNAELQWDFDQGMTADDYFGERPTHLLFSRAEQAWLWVKVVATRDIAVGEPVVVDASAGGAHQPRQVPDGFFPAAWLAQEETNYRIPQMLYPKLETGQVHPVEVDTTGQPLADYVHRVGLPPKFADTMEAWANEIGLTDILERYVTDKILPRGGEERFRVANGTWWTRRFGKTWQSDMHYIATDDDESNEQYFHKLAEGGFDNVLRGIGSHFNLTQLTCFYPSYIVVSHCVNAHMVSSRPFRQFFLGMD